jgi:hypothetical protein
VRNLFLAAVVAVTFLAFGLIGTQHTPAAAATQPLELAFTDVCEVRWEGPNGDDEREPFDEPSVVVARFNLDTGEWDKWFLQDSSRRHPVKGYLQIGKCY